MADKEKLSVDLSFLNNSYEEIQLPSKGLAYDKKSVLSKGVVNIRSWLTAEEKIIDKLTTVNFLSITSRLVKAAVQENIDINELTDADFYFLLYNIRALTYGPTYKVSTECPNCKERVDVTINIYDYPITYLEKYDDIITVTLPKTKITLKMRFPKVEDLLEATSEKHSDLFKNGLKVGNDIYRYALITEEMILPDGTSITKEVMPNMLSWSLNNVWCKLPAGDIKSIWKELRKSSHGYLTNAEVKCPKCESLFFMSPPLGYTFFHAELDDDEMD